MAKAVFLNLIAHFRLTLLKDLDRVILLSARLVFLKPSGNLIVRGLVFLFSYVISRELGRL